MLDEQGRFWGIITYYSLLYGSLGEGIDGVICRECIILDKSMWQQARRCFGRIHKRYGDVLLIPVIDKNWNMICFAYQDDEADREIRMLDELKEHKNALGFGDIYSKYSYVTIHECNELAYFFGYI